MIPGMPGFELTSFMGCCLPECSKVVRCVVMFTNQRGLPNCEKWSTSIFPLAQMSAPGK